uniref:CCHC-type domain-containing protein n=1 Tax=Tanacetum cinerariifolium TaxID=118510 RepID=A0A6L2M9X1_TANCI|nr:hypothetical protein [Tanacetum cinerariifolium]
MNYLEEQTDGEAVINCIKHGDQPLPRVTQVSIAGTSSTEQPPLKDKSMWSDQEKKIQKIDLINDLKKCGYSKDNYELNLKFLNNLQPEWKQYATMMRQNKSLMDINIDDLYDILKQNQRDVNDAIKEKVVVSSDSEGSDADVFSELKKITALLAKAINRRKFYSKPTNNNLRTSSASQSGNKKQEYVKSDDKKIEKKDDEKKQDMSKVKCYNCKKEGHFVKYCKKAKVKDYEYYKTKMPLAKKDKDEQVLLAEDHAWMESSSDSNQEINTNMVFMAQIEKVLSDSEASSSFADDKISEVSYYLSESKSESEYETLEYYDNTTTYAVDHNDSEGIDKLIRKFNKKIAKCLKRIEKANQQNKDFKNQNKDLQDKYDVLKNQATTFEMKNNELNVQMKVLIEKNDDLLAQTNVLKDQLQVKHVVIDTHVESRENKIEFAYDYGNLNASYVNEKINLSDDYFQEIINPDFDKIDFPFQQTSSLKPYVSNVILEKIIIDLEDEVVSLLDKKKENLKIIESLKSKNVEKGVDSSENVVSETENKSENDCQVIEKACDSEENPTVIAIGMFKLSVSQSVSLIFMTKTSCASNSVETKLKRKRCKRTSSKQNDKQVNNDVLRANRDFVYFSNLDTLSSVRRPKPSDVMWMKKGSSNTVNHSNLNKNVKRYSRKNLMACNNSDTRSVFDCSNARNALCNARMNVSVDVNDLFVFDDIVQIYLWIIDSGCSKHMMGNRALLTNFVEKFLGMDTKPYTRLRSPRSFQLGSTSGIGASAEEKLDKPNEIKARGTLLMALINKDQLKFHSYQDANLLMEAIEKRLQKLISQLEIQREVIQQEDMNLKLLRSLLSKWKTHALIWRNKEELETISLDDFTSSTNEADTTASGVSTAHTQGTIVNSTSVDNLSDAVIYAFLASQPNSPQLAKEDQEQINPDDLE